MIHPGSDMIGDSRRCALDDLTKLRALHLVQTFGLRPDLAVMIAAVAFGGGQ